MRGVAQLDEHLLGTVQQPRLEVVLSQFEQGGKPLLLAQIAALEQIAVHADRALGFAAAPKQTAQRKVQFDGFRIDLDHFDECLDRLVRLFIEQEIEAFEIGARQRAGFGHQVPDVDARREPAEPEEQRKPEQPPVFEFHGDASGRRRQESA